MAKRSGANEAAPRRSRRAMLGLGACGGLTLFASRAFGQTALPEADSGVTRVADLRYGSLPRQRLDAYLPARIRETTPLVLFWYGGAWRWGSKRRYGFVGEALAQQGIATAVADYRLHPEVAFPEFVRDCAQATAWVLDRAGPELGLSGLGGSRRLVLAGHSAGAYNAAMVALDPRYLAAFGRKPGELAGWIGLAGMYDFLPLRYPASLARDSVARDNGGRECDLSARRDRLRRRGGPHLEQRAVNAAQVVNHPSDRAGGTAGMPAASLDRKAHGLVNVVAESTAFPPAATAATLRLRQTCRTRGQSAGQVAVRDARVSLHRTLASAARRTPIAFPGRPGRAAVWKLQAVTCCAGIGYDRDDSRGRSNRRANALLSGNSLTRAPCCPRSPATVAPGKAAKSTTASPQPGRPC